MGIRTGREFFAHRLADAYDAEKRIAAAIGKVAHKVQHDRLALELERHQQEAERHAERIERIFETLGEKPKRLSCKGSAGLITEITEFYKENKPSDPIADLFAVEAGKKAMHYEMVNYEMLISIARKLALNGVVGMLQQNLQDERSAVQKMDQLGNELAGNLPEEEEEEELAMSGGSSKRGRGR